MPTKKSRSKKRGPGRPRKPGRPKGSKSKRRSTRRKSPKKASRSRRGPGRPRKVGRPKSRSTKRRSPKRAPRSKLQRMTVAQRRSHCRSKHRVYDPRTKKCKMTYRVRSKRRTPEMVCRGRSRRACGSNPNCEWTKGTGCHYRRGVTGGVRYFGPTLAE